MKETFDTKLNTENMYSNGLNEADEESYHKYQFKVTNDSQE